MDNTEKIKDKNVVLVGDFSIDN
mgnify:CR=1